MTDPNHPSTEDFDPFAAPVAVTLPTTPAQLEMWLAEKADSGAGRAYVESFSVRLTGAVNDEALVRALQTLPEFHEALRGRFSEDGRDFILAPKVDIPIARHDMTGLSPADREAEVERIVREDAATPYNLAEGPLFRASILALDGHTRIILLGAHHLVCDGWSLDVLLADFGRLYSGFTGAAPLPDPPRHGIADYIAYCETHALRDKVEKSRAYWRHQFTDVPEPLSLPVDGQRPPVRTYRATHARLGVAPELLSELRAFAKQNQVSLFSVLLSGYATLLHRIAGAADLVVGIPVAGHPEADMEECVGHLVNLVPVRVRFAPGETFHGLCWKVSEQILDAREYAHVGFGEILKDLKLARDPSRIPLVPVMFTHVQKYAPGKLTFAGCEVDYVLNPRVAETFELSLNALEAKDGLTLQAHANADMFSPQWLFFRLRELEALLRELVGHPDKPLGDLPFLPKDELAILLAEAERAKQDYRREASMADLFASQARACPEAVAAIAGDASVTYAGLDTRSNQIARVLRARGIGRGQLVGLCLERGLPMLAALLAVQKSGAGYIPLDPAFPPERLAFMVEDSKLSLVVSQASLAGVHGCPAAKTIEMDTYAALIEGESGDPLPADEHSAGPDDIAYVLYTSGSTGKPKGVQVHHRAAVNFLESMRKEPGIAQGDRLLAVTTLSFDIALLELMGSLTAGATIVLASRDQAMDGEALLALLHRHDISLLQATPVTWRLLLAAGWQGSPTLKALVGGEALPKDLAVALVPKVAELWNMYGPTETTVWSTCGRIVDPDKPIHIGRPIANTTVWILDPRGNPCPVGVVGEIHIGGDGVAKGYLGRPELTAEKFIPDPFAEEPGARLYRTGDLGRIRGDGTIECLGRVDFQVKIRGYRIELGEIEGVLAKHPAIKEAVVVARADAGADPYLVAYVRGDESPVDQQVLRTHLKASLPDYMVPQYFVHLESFPLTPNGKIDRKALPIPAPSTVARAPSAARSAGSAIERDLEQIWKQVLKLDQVGVDQNFFEIGGHSLLGISMGVEITKRFGVKLPLSQLLQTPTIEGLAQVLDGQKGTPKVASTADPHLVEIRAGGPGNIFFIYDGFGEVIPYLNLAQAMPTTFGVYGILPRSQANIPLAHASVSQMAKHCMEVICRRQPEGPYLVGGLCAGGVIAFATAEWLEDQGEEVQAVLLLDAAAPTVALKWWRTSMQRWRRFSQAIRVGQKPPSPSTTPPGGVSSSETTTRSGAAMRALGKIHGLLAFETQHVAQTISTAIRFRILRHVLENRQPWPAWVPPLTVPDILDSAGSAYQPGCIRAPVLLVRAGMGAVEDVDAPAIDLVLDPNFGWEGYSQAGLRVMDTQGGHSGMLQKPYVEGLAKLITDELGRRPGGGGVPRAEQSLGG